MTERIIAFYRIKTQLGSGGMGDVFLAEDTRLDRHVALKLVTAGSSDDPDLRQRFITEAKAVSALNHPNVCTIYDVGQTDDHQPYIAMEYVEGESLGQLESLDIKAVLDIGHQVANALDAAHSRGIIHRDIKPSNIMITERGQAKVLDFGLAKRSTVPDQTDPNATTQYRTAVGQVLGTPGFMSPEQALGKPVDQRTDIFSFGVLLYRLTTGRLPFTGANFSEATDKIINAQPVPIVRLNYDVPHELERIILKCLEKDVEDRYQHAKDLLIDLRMVKRMLDAPSAGDTSVESDVVTLVCAEASTFSELKRGGNAKAAENVLGQFSTALRQALKTYTQASVRAKFFEWSP